jgi:hypothetical protein
MLSLEFPEQSMPALRDLPTQHLGDEAMVRDPDNGQVHFLNPTAALIWQCCDGKTTFAECAGRLRAAYAIPPEVNLAEDILATLGEFRRKGLLLTNEQ